MRDVIGSTSAATLGYITGGIKGAKRAAELYQNYAMAKKKSIGARRSDGGLKRKAGSDDTWKTVKKRRTVRGSRVVTQRSQGTNKMQVEVRKRGTSVHRKAVRKTIPVSRTFRKKVKHALQSVYAVGRYTDVHTGGTFPIDNKQKNVLLGYTSQGKASFFSPSWVLSQCSVLFNGKTAVQSNSATDNFNFDFRTFKVNVQKSWVKVKFKNNSARTMYVSVYACSPKHMNYGDGFDALEYWTTSMIQDRTANGLAGNLINVESATPETLYTSPNSSPKWSQMFGADKTYVVLEPGKEYHYYLPGPSNYEYDFAKYVSGQSSPTIFNNMQKMLKMIMVSFYCDLAYTNPVNPGAGKIGRFTTMDDANRNYGLVWEITQHARFSVPEQAGLKFQTLSAGTVVTHSLNKRIDCYVYKNWADISQGDDTIHNIDDENPQDNTMEGN